MVILQKFFNKFKKRWKTSGGYLEFLSIALPLIISTASWSVQNFINRLLLSWYSPEAYAAALPAGMLTFSIMSIFIGTVMYVDVFVAQYYGKKEYKAIGPSVWQSVYVALLGGIVLFIFSLFSSSIFSSVGHPVDIVVEEIKYFRILCYGAFPSLAASALSGFYAGRGKTKVVVVVNIIGVIINLALDYLLIFGNFGFKEMGIEGAALATIISSISMMVIYIFMITSKHNNFYYNTKNFKLDILFIKKLIKFGLPNGVQFFFDMAGFTIFIFIIGHLGKVVLSASSIALNINMLTFMPLVGCGITVSILVGQYLGRNKANLASISTYTAFHIAYAYVFVLVAIYLFIPNIFIAPFLREVEPDIVAQVQPMAINILRFISLYVILDPINIIFASAIKGAGDTAFVMKLLIVTSIVCVAIPIYIVINVLGMGVYAGWSVIVVYASVLAISFYLRYKTNKWRTMRVVDMVVVEN